MFHYHTVCFLSRTIFLRLIATFYFHSQTCKYIQTKSHIFAQHFPALLFTISIFFRHNHKDFLFFFAGITNTKLCLIRVLTPKSRIICFSHELNRFIRAHNKTIIILRMSNRKKASLYFDQNGNQTIFL